MGKDSKGDSVSSRTMLRAAKLGKPVRFSLSQSWSIIGYLCGMDDYHWKVVDAAEPSEVHLIHKGTVVATVLEGGLPWMQIASDDLRQRIEHMVTPFRDQVKGL